MPNMANVIRNHSTTLLKDHTPADIKECSCHQETECPLDKRCLSGYLTKLNIIMELARRTLKSNHAASFRNKESGS